MVSSAWTFRSLAMRGVLFLSVVSLAFLFAARAHAETYFWVGSGANLSWTYAGNWSTVERGGPTGTHAVPGAADTVIFTASGTTVQVKSAVTVAAMTIGRTWTGSITVATGALTVTNALRMGSGRLLGGSGNFTVGSVTQTGGVIGQLGANFTITGAGGLSITDGNGTGIPDPSFTSTGTLLFTGSADQTFTKGASTTLSLSNLTINNSGGTDADDIAANINGGLNLSGALTITVGNLDLATNNTPLVVEGAVVLTSNAQTTLDTDQDMTFGGDVTVGALSTFRQTAGTTTLNNNTADQTVTPSTLTNFYNVTINKTEGASADDVIIATMPLNVSGALTITQGNLDLTTNSLALVVDDGDITIANSAQAALTSNSNVTHSGGLTVNTSGIFALTGGTWTNIDDGDVTYTLTGANKHFFSLTLNNSGGGSNDDLTIAGSGLNLSGALTITNGNLALNTNSQAMVVEGGITLADDADATLVTNSNVTASGTILVNDAATLTVSAGTWTLNDNSDQAFDIDGQSLYNLTINNSGGGSIDDIVVAGGTLAVAGDLTVTAGNLDLDTNTLALDVDGNMTLASAAQSTFTGSTINLAGDLTVGSLATFNNRAGTATLDGTNQTLSGAITFNNLTKQVAAAYTLTFAATNTVTILDTLTLQGVSNDTRFSLRSSQTGTAWKIDPQTTRNLRFLDVRDSNNTNATSVSCWADSCVNTANNSGWTFATTGAAGTTATTASTSGGSARRGGGGGGGGSTVKKATTKTVTPAKVVKPTTKPSTRKTVTPAKKTTTKTVTPAKKTTTKKATKPSSRRSR